MTQHDYTFSTSTAETVAVQLDSLQNYLDPVTFRHLDQLDLPEGARCWEVGAGSGSVAKWLADLVGPGGHVVASDINTGGLGHLDRHDNVTVVEHDVTTLTSPEDRGSYDLIHARLVLLHLKEREEVLKTLAAHLAPGGRLLLEEFDCTRPLHVYASRSDADTDLFGRVTRAIIDTLVTNGADFTWSHAVHPAMRAAGLVDVHTVTHSESWAGGGSGARLHEANTYQLVAQLTAAGFTADDLDRFRGIVGDPAHAAASHLLVSTRGRRPAASSMES